MAKQLNVDLRFNADTGQAKSKIQELQNSLNQLSTTLTSKNVDFSLPSIQKATTEVNKLQYALNQAFNVDTGKLDLTKFNSTLKHSGTSLNQLRTSLSAVGPQGQQAFLNLAKSIAVAEVPVSRINKLFSELGTTLMNTARWQIASSALHAIAGAVSSAYYYAQDLNESLNNIRIVTGQSAEQMARFAEEANKTARSLSSSTLDYTNASLIYYQQGLDDAAVKERTDVTIKMANVARESAETVSEQMTAIWNNFDDGSKSLEYYADVITALGAATASSSSEISQGLEKFAAVADTVGLSYENATAALATITATTRQSADTVGTGLRTLFSRLQGLSLGDTLEDGVDLNKYSKALEKVGVQALDASGNLRRMDDVLEDLGARWGQLSNAQQTALAQTIGGVRQYTTLIALMDNWDFMKQNQQVAAGAEGTLQEQADIYAESWEAARDRVQAAAQSIYTTLIDDDFFIKLLKGFETALTYLKNFMDSIGGLKGVLLGLSTVVLKLFSGQIATGFENIIFNLRSMVGLNKQNEEAIRKEAAAQAQLVKVGVTDSKSQQMATENLQKQVQLSSILTSSKRKLSTQEQFIANQILSQFDAQSQANIEAQIAVEKAKQHLAVIERVAAEHENSTAVQERLTEATAAYEIALTHAESAEKNIGSQFEYAKEQLLELIKGTNKIPNYYEIFTSAAQGLSSLAFGISSVINSFKILGDESASTGEKITSLISGLAMGLPMAIQGIVTLGNAGTALGTKLLPGILASTGAIEAQTAATWANTAAIKLNDTTNVNFTAHQLALIAAKKGLISQTNLEILTKNIENATQEKGSALTKKEILDILIQTEGKKGETTSRWANVVAMAAEKSSLLGLLAAAAPYIAILGVLAAAIALIIRHNKQLEAQQPEKVFERTTKAINDEKEALDECKTKVDDLKKAFDGYDNIVDKLKDCDKGTKEWAETLNAANQEVLALLGKYPELQDYIERNADGLLTFKSGAQDIITQQANEELFAQQNKYYSAQIANASAGLDVERSQIKVNNITGGARTNDEIRAVGIKLARQQMEGTGAGFSDRNNIISTLKDAGFVNEYEYQEYEDAPATRIENALDQLADAFEQYADLYFDFIDKEKGVQEQQQLYADEIARNYTDNANVNSIFQNAGVNDAVSEAYLNALNSIKDDYSTGKLSVDFRKWAETQGFEQNNIKYDSTTGLVTYFKQNAKGDLEEMTTTWERVISDLSYQGAMEAANLDTIIQENINKISEDSGLNDLGLNNTEKDIFLDAFNSIDWTNQTEGLVQFKELLAAIGINIPDDKLGTFVDNILSLNEALTKTPLDTSENAYKTLINSQETMSSAKQTQEEYASMTHKDRLLNGISKEDIKENAEAVIEATQAYEKARKDYEQAIVTERKSQVEALGGDTDQFEKYTVAVKNLAKAVKDGSAKFKDLAASVADNDVEAAELAKDFSRFDLAIESATENMENWQAAFDSGTPYEYAQALEEVRSTYGNLLDLDGSALSEEFLTSADNLNLMEAALNGDAEAYEQLLDLANQDLLAGIRAGLEENDGDLDRFNSALNTVRANMEQMGWDALDAGATIEEALANLPDGIDLDNQGFLDSLTEMVTAAGLTAEEATNLLSSMGIDAEVETVDPETQTTNTENQYWVPATYRSRIRLTGGEEKTGTWTYMEVDKPGHWESVPGQSQTVTPGTASIRVTSAHKSAGGNIKFNHSAGGAKRAASNRSSGSKGGGKGSSGSGGSKSKPSTPKTAEDRYHDTLNRREKQKNAFDKAQNEKEELWGQARIKKWKEAQKALEAYIKAQQDLLKDTERWLKTDKKALQDALSKINVTITPQFDENGTITNYEAILGQINNLYQKYNGNEDMTALIEAAQKALEQYDKTSDLWIDRKKELDDLNKQLDKLRKEEQIEQKERERYHRIERELAENDRKLDEERRKKERAYGEERLAYLREEQKLLQERQKLYEQYLAEIETDRKYIDQDRNDLIEAFSALGLNVEFDENGEIANIEELFDKVHAAWESGDNSMFGTDPEEAEKRWDKFTKTIERYEDTLNSLHETEQKLAEVTDELLDNILELVTTQVELRIEISDRDLKRIEYALKHIEDDVYKTAEALALLGRQGDVAMNKIAAYEQGIADILNISLEEFQTLSDSDLQTLLSNLDANAITQVEEYCDALREQKTELMELQKTIVDKVLSAYDELNEKIDEAYDRFSQFSDLLSSYNEIVELSAGAFGPLTDQIQDFIRTTNISNAQNQTTAARERLAAAQADLAAYSGDNEEILKRLQEAVRSANEAFLSSIQETLQALQEAYENAFNDIFDNLDKWVDNAEKAYGRQKELNEEYLTDYEKTYQLNKLSRDLDKTLNNTNSAKGRARLLELQKEINDGMADANRLSAYDVEFLQKKLALEQARLDLENARNAKSYMQLQRGADGQWGYVYTANEEAVEQAEQAYEDRQHDLYELQKRQEASLTDQLHSLAQSRAQAMRDLESNRKDMTEEEYQAERAALENHFQERARYMFEQMGNLFDNNNWADQLYNMGLALGISESTLSSIVEHDDLGEAMALFLNHFGDAQAQSDEEYAQYISAVKNFLSSNDVTVETLQAAIENIGFGSLENVDNVIAASADLSTTFAHSMDVANEELNKLQQAIDSVTDSLDPFIDRLYGVMTILEGGTPINLSDIDLTPSDKITPSPMPIGLLNSGYSVMPTPISNPSDIDVGQVLQALSYINGDSMSSVGENFLRSVMPRLPDFLTSMLEQNVQITASFPSVIDHNEIEEAFNNLINKATQYANRKNMRSITFGDSYNS